MLSPSDYSKVKDKQASDQLFKLYVEGKFTEYSKSISDLKTEIGNVRSVATNAKNIAIEANNKVISLKDDLRAKNKPTYWEKILKVFK